MRYWNFDVLELIRDYPKNKRTLDSIYAAAEVASGYIDNPIGATSRGDWEMYLKILDLRRKEYEMYVDLVRNGLSDLPEVERLVLVWWLVKGYKDKDIMEHVGLESAQELRKIKKIAVTKFTNLVMPD